MAQGVVHGERDFGLKCVELGGNEKSCHLKPCQHCYIFGDWFYTPRGRGQVCLNH